MPSPLLWPALFLLAFLMGFVADRTNLCSVSAVEEIIIERRASLLWSFTKIALWVLGIAMLIEVFFSYPGNTDQFFSPSWVSMVGGLLFGIGATLNGGCSLRTLTRLGRGDIRMVISLLGLPIGALGARALILAMPVLAPAPAQQALVNEVNQRQILLLLLSLWMLWEGFQLLRGFRTSEFRARVLAPAYKPGSSAAVLGIANGILFSLVGTWMLTYTLVQGITNVGFPDSQFYHPIAPALWVLLAVYLIGVAVSAVQARHLMLQARPGPDWLRYLVGGGLMGFGATLVPGGNDLLLLNGIPGLSAHGIPAYLSMLVGIACALAIGMKFMPGRMQHNCD